MKRLGQCLLGLTFAALFALSCRALVAHPPEDSPARPFLPVEQAVLRAATEAVPAEDMLAQHLPGAASRRVLSDVTVAASLPTSIPVRDGNGIPLGRKPYVRTVYTACRLEASSG